MRVDSPKLRKEFAARILESAIKNDADQAEVFVKHTKNLSVDVKDQSADAFESSISFGYSLRVIKDNRLGFSYSTALDDWDLVVKNAVETAKWTEPDEFLLLPENHGIPIPEYERIDIYDRAIENLNKEDALTNVLEIEKSAKDFDSRIKKIRKASGSFDTGEVLLLNSKGIEFMYPYTACTAQIMLVAEEDNDSQMGWDFEGARYLSDISFKNIGKTAAQRAVQLLGSQKIQTVRAPVLLDSTVASEFLGIFASSFSADAVQKGKSLLINKVGKKIISLKADIIDSGLLPRRLGSRLFDDEGVLTSEKILVQNGALQGFLHNTYTAKKAGTVSTGNAMRSSHAGLPSVGITNLFIKPSSPSDTITFKNLFNSIDKGLYVTEAMGIHTANPISGEFSIGVSGLWIENGEIKFPVKEAVISGNILEFFERIEGFGDDVKFYGNIGTPSLLIGTTDISG